MEKKTIIIVGAVPPPYHGQNISFERFLRSEAQNEFKLLFVDISDHRDTANLGKLDVVNVILAMKCILQSAWYSLFSKNQGLYLSLSQSPLPFLRDALTIVGYRVFSPRGRIIVHLRGGYFSKFYEESGPLWKLLIDSTMRSIDDAIILGKNLSGNFKRWLDEEKHIHVVPNGTTMNPKTVDTESCLDMKKPIRLIYLSSIIPSKGIFDVLRAFAEFLKSNRVGILTIAGERHCGDPFDNRPAEVVTREFRSLVSDPNLRNHIRDLGVIMGSEKERELLLSDILLLPTYYPFEGLPNAILEGMAAGCAIISTSHAAIPEVVQDGENGFIVGKRNYGEIVQRLIKLSDDRELLSTMKLNARKKFKNDFTAEKSNALLIEVMAKCLAV